MVQRFAWVVAFVALSASGLSWLANASEPAPYQEEWVNPNLVRVFVDGKWHEFPLVPLRHNARPASKNGRQNAPGAHAR